MTLRMWRTPEPGDIVWCFFPQRPRDMPGPKPRSSLVLAVNQFQEGVTVQVAYGTSQKLDRLASGEFVIRKFDHPAAYATAGITFDTKFNLKHTIELPWNDLFFSVPPQPHHGQNPKLGSLHIGLQKVVEATVRAAQR